jgi:hypothetical protein
VKRNHGFDNIAVLEGLPQSDKARAILEELSEDPGVLAVMEKHRWNVGTLCEMYPEGYVGVSDVCVMGLNENKGQRILLRLRTDDLKGFRKILSIRAVLFHELAHNEHGDHDDKFYMLMRQIEREVKELDWRNSTAKRLGSAYTAAHHSLPATALAGTAALRRFEDASRDHTIPAYANNNETPTKEGEQQLPSASGSVSNVGWDEQKTRDGAHEVDNNEKSDENVDEDEDEDDDSDGGMDWGSCGCVAVANSTSQCCQDVGTLPTVQMPTTEQQVSAERLNAVPSISSISADHRTSKERSVPMDIDAVAASISAASSDLAASIPQAGSSEHIARTGEIKDISKVADTSSCSNIDGASNMNFLDSAINITNTSSVSVNTESPTEENMEKPAGNVERPVVNMDIEHTKELSPNLLDQRQQQQQQQQQQQLQHQQLLSREMATRIMSTVDDAIVLVLSLDEASAPIERMQAIRDAFSTFTSDYMDYNNHSDGNSTVTASVGAGLGGAISLAEQFAEAVKMLRLIIGNLQVLYYFL